MSCHAPRTGQLYACHAAALVHNHMNWTHHEVGKVEIGRMASTLTAAKECGFSIAFCRDPLATTTIAIAATAADMPMSAGDKFLDCEQGHTRAEIVGSGEARWSRKARLVAGRAPSSTATARCSSFAANDVGQGGASVSLPRPEGVLHDGNPSHGVDGPNGLATPTEKRDSGASLSLASSEGCRRRDVCDGGKEGASATATPIPAKPDSVVEVSSFGGAVPRDGAAVAEEGGASSHRREDAGLSEMPPMHAERFPEAAEEEEDAGKFVDISASGEGPSSPSFCRVVVVGAGASGLSAAACLRARGEADVLILER